jgi:hypothetical protein
MKHTAVIFKALLLFVVFAPLAGCKGGAFIDPGHVAATNGGSGGSYSGGGGSKPSELSSNASYEEAIEKLDAIIDYCERNPGSAVNQIALVYAQYTIGELTNDPSVWENERSDIINEINDCIGDLE